VCCRVLCCYPDDVCHADNVVWCVDPCGERVSRTGDVVGRPRSTPLTYHLLSTADAVVSLRRHYTKTSTLTRDLWRHGHLAWEDFVTRIYRSGQTAGDVIPWTDELIAAVLSDVGDSVSVVGCVVYWLITDREMARWTHSLSNVASALLCQFFMWGISTSQPRTVLGFDNDGHKQLPWRPQACFLKTVWPGA